MPVGIVHIDENSLAAKAELNRKNIVLSINGVEVTDALDFHFYSADDSLDIEIRRDENAEAETISLEREFSGQPLGIEVEELVIRHCRCNCVFCFVHQNPEGLRETLYIKDEDYRFSFLYGNYITGINLSETDIERIINMKLSPLYFSVHTTKEALRMHLLGIKRGHAIMPLLERLTSNGIEIHTQIVLCPGMNDDDELLSTVDDLLSLYPNLGSIAIVPLGLTQWRDGLPELKPFNADYAGHLIDWIAPHQKSAQEQCGEPVLLLADEIYLMAGLPYPTYDDWEESPQLENGVGMASIWYQDFEEISAGLPISIPQPKRVAAFTTHLSAKVIKRACDKLSAIDNLSVEIIPLSNSLWGETIQVTGLLPGIDFKNAIKNNPEFDLYLIPGNSVRRWDNIFLDDVKMEEIQASTSKPVKAVKGGFDNFASAILD